MAKKNKSKTSPKIVQEETIAEEGKKPSTKKLGSEIDEIFAGKKRKKTESEKTEKDATAKPKKVKKKKNYSNKVREDEDGGFGDSSSKPRKKTADGLTIYTDEELGINNSEAGGIRRKSVQRAIVTKFDDCLTSKVAESSRRSDHVQASEDLINKLMEVVCLAFSGNAAVRGYSNRMEEKVTSLDSEVKKAKHAEKVALDKAKKAEEQATKAEDARRKAEESRKKAEDELSATRSEHFRYLQEMLHAALEQARRQAVAEYQNSAEFEARLREEYKEGMRDMKAGFVVTNPTLTGVDWSFVPEVSGETAAEEDGAAVGGAEEGEVTGGEHVAEVVAEDVVVIDEPEARYDPSGTERVALDNQQ